MDGKDCYFYDSSGKRYLDFSSQLMCVNLGYKNEAVVKAIAEQAEKLAYIGPSFSTVPRAELTELLMEVMPHGLVKYFFSPSGTEANEAAIKIARLYKGKHKIISRYRSYHGATAGSIGVTGEFRRWPSEPIGKIDGVAFAPDADCYRCPLNLEYPDCALACAEYVDYMMKHEGDVAAVIVEPVVGTNGVLVPPDEYLPRLREITQENDALLIVDEVMSGWGRTGEWFAVDHWKVKPDILTTAKGITSAYTPLGLTATTQEIADYFEDHYFAHGHTYEAHPLALASAVATIKEYKRLKIIERVKKMGRYLGSRLQELKDRHQSVGDVRGMGLFWAVELVRNRKTKEPFNNPADKLAGRPIFIEKLGAEMLQRGVFLFSWMSHFVIAPPLIATEKEIDEGVAALDQVLAQADKETSK